MHCTLSEHLCVKLRIFAVLQKLTLLLDLISDFCRAKGGFIEELIFEAMM